MKLSIKTTVGISLGVALIASTVVLMIVYIPHTQQPELSEHVPIVIWEDEDFKNYNFEGEGTEEKPYLIQHLNITTENGYGIFIRDTTVHFQIQNCYINPSRVGIRIAEASSGTFKLIDNTITQSFTGIEIISSDNSLLLRNNCSFNPVCVEYTPEYLAGIAIVSSANTSLIDNICIENGYYGILLSYANSSSLINNICNEAQISGIRASSSPNSIFINNTCNNNENFCEFFPDDDANGISISLSENSTIVNNTCSNNKHNGISLWKSPNSELKNNSCENNQLYGIHIQDSNNTNLSNNLCIWNYLGIFLSETYNCNLIFNKLVLNVIYGISLNVLSGSNSVHHNYFVYHLMGISQACDDGVGNIWYDGVALEGNYWNNWSGIGTYAIDGSANSVDLYPLDYIP